MVELSLQKGMLGGRLRATKESEILGSPKLGGIRRLASLISDDSESGVQAVGFHQRLCYPRVGLQAEDRGVEHPPHMFVRGLGRQHLPDLIIDVEMQLHPSGVLAEAWPLLGKATDVRGAGGRWGACLFGSDRVRVLIE